MAQEPRQVYDLFQEAVEQISPLFFLFLIFHAKNMKKADFDQRLECAAPKPWSKYTASA